ncbi:MAG: hypothetical protein JKY53_06335 [Flavobacteriales bacterium]|nr:hypothetical protein [Flavobacteriales bacterium]
MIFPATPNIMRFFTIALLLVFIACSSSKDVSEPKVKTTQQWVDEGYTSATIKDFSSLDGCTYLVVTEKGTKLMPSNLAKEFQKDRLAVWIKYHPSKSSMNICMKGISVTVDDIQLREL